MMRDMSAWQRSAWVWAACLAQAAAILPAVAARAGAGGWIAPVLALPAVCVADRLLERVNGGGLARKFCEVLGKWGGRALTIIYIMWAVMLGGAQLCISIQRVETAATVSVKPWVLAAGIVLLALWMVRGRPSACARWCVIVLRGTLVVLGVITLLALRQTRRDNLLPFWDGGESLVGAVGLAFAVMCVRVYGEFVPGDSGERRMKRYPALVCVLLSGLLLTVQGNLGTALAARLEDPLLALSRNVGVEGAFQRAESLLAAILLLADLALLALLLWAARSAAGQVWPACGAGLIAAVAGLTMFAAANLPAYAAQVEMFRYRIVPVGNFVFGLVIPLVLLVAERVKDGKTGAYIVPENEENGTYCSRKKTSKKMKKRC